MNEASNGLVLVVDDEPDLVSTMSQLLQDMGFQTLEAMNGQMALDKYRERHEDITLVLCDISMPMMDGLEFFKNALGHVGFVPIVMVTAHADVPRMTEAVRLGAIDYFVKPFDPETLEKQIHIWQEIARRHKANLGDPKTVKMEALMRVRSSETLKKLKTS